MNKPTFTDSVCDKCGQFTMFPSLHECPPAWEVCFGETADEAEDNGITIVFEHSAAGAVETAAEKDDCQNDYIMAKNGEGIGWARKDGEFTWKKFTLYAEQITTYTANESKE